MSKQLTTPEQALDAMIDCHRAFYIERQGDELMASYILWRRNGEIVPVMLASMPKKYADKKNMVACVRQKLEELGDVYMFAFLSEGWSLPPMSPAELRALKTSPTQSEHRIEVVNTFIGHRDGTRCFVMHELVRDWQSGHVVELKNLTPADNSAVVAVPVFDLFAAARREDDA